ncbi:phosphatidylinositol-3-phosphatase ymr1 [Umbelopsis nana]
MAQHRIDLIKVSQVSDVQLEKNQDVFSGTLHLTDHNLIFSHSEGELWIPYPIIHYVERRPQSTSSNLYPLYIKCRDFLIFTLCMPNDRDAQDVFDVVQKLTCISSTEQLYAYSFQPRPLYTSTDGWKLYDPVAEFERMGVGKIDSWRFSSINRDYSFSPTYPRVLVVPSKISDNVLNYAAKYRSKARIPALSYLHWANKATITRCSQPMVGIKQARSIQDEKLIEAIFASNVPNGLNGQVVYGSTAANLIIDARPMANAVGNVARGAGTENMENYRNCKKKYTGIDNIHVMRDSLARMCDAMQGSESIGGMINKFALQRSNWLKHISSLLDGTLVIVKSVHIFNSHVLVHCSDGWDRTAQLVSIAELCLDPFYRTYRGFQILIEKEWVAFGHKFADRCGHISNEKYFINLANTGGSAAANTIKDMQNKLYKSGFHQRETSPVFHQFLDCVFQLIKQYPARFAFNEKMLSELHYHVYSCQFGTFLFNSEYERTQNQPQSKTCSIWDYFNSNYDEFTNPDYDPKLDQDISHDGGVLLPDPKNVQYWASLFGRSDEDVNEAAVPSTPLQYIEATDVADSDPESGVRKHVRPVTKPQVPVSESNGSLNTPDGTTIDSTLTSSLRDTVTVPSSSNFTDPLSDPLTSSNSSVSSNQASKPGIDFGEVSSRIGTMVNSFSRFTMNVGEAMYSRARSTSESVTPQHVERELGEIDRWPATKTSSSTNELFSSSGDNKNGSPLRSSSSPHLIHTTSPQSTPARRPSPLSTPSDPLEVASPHELASPKWTTKAPTPKEEPDLTKEQQQMDLKDLPHPLWISDSQ